MRKHLKLFLIVFFSALIIQFVLILYKDYSGYVPLKGVGHFLISLSVGTLISSFFMMFIVLLDLKLIEFFNRRLPWQNNKIKRILSELPLVVVLAIFISTTMTAFAHILFTYDKPLFDVFLKNAIMVSIVNLLIISIAEAVIFYNQSRKIQLQSEKLKRENLSLRFETLKKQLDPHFLFNSLNNLHALIGNDKEKAQSFIQDFSSIYRYTLDVIDKPVVTLREEMSYVESYLKLQKIRFGDALEIEIKINEKNMDLLVPPLAVQTLLENAFKHNKVTQKQPLKINIHSMGDYLVIANSLQLKTNPAHKKGIGFDNLKKRYQLVTEKLPDVIITNDFYTVKLPFVETEKL